MASISQYYNNSSYIFELYGALIIINEIIKMLQTIDNTLKYIIYFLN